MSLNEFCTECNHVVSPRQSRRENGDPFLSFLFLLAMNAMQKLLAKAPLQVTQVTQVIQVTQVTAIFQFGSSPCFLLQVVLSCPFAGTCPKELTPKACKTCCFLFGTSHRIPSSKTDQMGNSLGVLGSGESTDSMVPLRQVTKLGREGRWESALLLIEEVGDRFG